MHHDQPHWQQAYDRGQPGIFNIAGEPNRSLVETVCRANRRVLSSVRRSLDATSLAEIQDAYNEIKASWRVYYGLPDSKPDRIPHTGPSHSMETGSWQVARVPAELLALGCDATLGHGFAVRR